MKPEYSVSGLMPFLMSVPPLPRPPEPAVASRHRPLSLQEPADCSQEEAECRQRIREKTRQLKDLVLRQIAFKNLVERNRRVSTARGEVGGEG